MAEIVTLYQADCEDCGWHTRQTESRSWVAVMAEAHRQTCPNKPPGTQPELCKVPAAAAKGRCAYAGPDGKDACKMRCIWRDTSTTDAVNDGSHK